MPGFERGTGGMGEDAEGEAMRGKASGGGIGFCGMLTILFIGLKITGYIDWSWLWVLAPIWIPGVVVVSLIILVVIAEEKRGKR